MDPVVVLSVVAVAIVVIFDFTNGFHDASNIIATVIASRAMTPVQAVVLVAIFEFLGPFIVGMAVANTIGNFVDLSDLLLINAVAVIICGIFAALFWNVLTWRLGSSRRPRPTRWSVASSALFSSPPVPASTMSSGASLSCSTARSPVSSKSSSAWSSRRSSVSASAS